MRELVLALAAACASSALAFDPPQLFYENTTPTVLDSFGNLDTGAIMLDDVLIPASRLSAPALVVMKIRVRLFGPVAGTVNLNAWFAGAYDDGLRALPDTPPIRFASRTVEFPGDNWTVTMDVGSGAEPLFVVDLLPVSYEGEAYSMFFLGLSFDKPLSDVGWVTADGPDVNIPDFYGYYGGGDTRNGLKEFLGVPGSFYLEVVGTPVPDPGAAVALPAGLVWVALLLRRR